MADKNPPPDGGKLQQHPLIERLTGGTAEAVGAPSPPPDASVFSGYPARDPEPGFWRVYEDLGFQSYLRVAEADVVATQTLATDEEPLRPSVVWVRRGAELEQTRVETRRAQAGFLAGPLAGGRGGIVPEAARAAPGIAPTLMRAFCDSAVDACPSGFVPCPPSQFGPCASQFDGCVTIDQIRCPDTRQWCPSAVDACPTRFECPSQGDWCPSGFACPTGRFLNCGFTRPFGCPTRDLVGCQSLGIACTIVECPR